MLLFSITKQYDKEVKHQKGEKEVKKRICLEFS